MPTKGTATQAIFDFRLHLVQVGEGYADKGHCDNLGWFRFYLGFAKVGEGYADRGHCDINDFYYERQQRTQ